MKEESIVNMIEKVLRSHLTEVGWPNGNVGHYIFERDIPRVVKEVETYIAGRSKSIESEKAKEERIKELEAEVKRLKDDNKRDPWDDLGKNLSETTF